MKEINRSSFKKKKHIIKIFLFFLFSAILTLLFFNSGQPVRAQGSCACIWQSDDNRCIPSLENACGVGYEPRCYFSASEACDCECVLSNIIPPPNLPRIIEEAMPDFEFKNGTVADIINALVPYIFALAGLLLLIFLILGGFELMTSGGSPEKIESGRKKIMAAVIGFLIIFVAYWGIQILERIFGIAITGMEAPGPSPTPIPSCTPPGGLCGGSHPPCCQGLCDRGRCP